MATHGVKLGTLKQCFQFLEWLNGSQGQKNHVVTQLVQRLTPYFHQMSNHKAALHIEYFKFLPNVSTLRTKLLSNLVTTLGDYTVQTSNINHILDALLECIPKFLAALYYLQYHVDDRYRNVGGGDWAPIDLNKGPIMEFLTTNDAIMKGGFDAKELSNVKGNTLVYDLNKILNKAVTRRGKAGHDHFRNVILTTLEKPWNNFNTGNTVSLVYAFCELVTEEKSANGGEFKVALEADLLDQKICWEDLKSHCQILHGHIKTLTDAGFSVTGRGVKPTNAVNFAKVAATWFRNNLPEAAKVLGTMIPHRIDIETLRSFAKDQLYPHGFIFDGSKQRVWPSSTMLNKWDPAFQKFQQLHGTLLTLKRILDGEPCSSQAPPPKPRPRPAPAPRPPRPARPAPPPRPATPTTDNSSGAQGFRGARGNQNSVHSRRPTSGAGRGKGGRGGASHSASGAQRSANKAQQVGQTSTASASAHVQASPSQKAVQSQDADNSSNQQVAGIQEPSKIQGTPEQDASESSGGTPSSTSTVKTPANIPFVGPHAKAEHSRSPIAAATLGPSGPSGDSGDQRSVLQLYVQPSESVSSSVPNGKSGQSLPTDEDPAGAAATHPTTNRAVVDGDDGIGGNVTAGGIRRPGGSDSAGRSESPPLPAPPAESQPLPAGFGPITGTEASKSVVPGEKVPVAPPKKPEAPPAKSPGSPETSEGAHGRGTKAEGTPDVGTGQSRDKSLASQIPDSESAPSPSAKGDAGPAAPKGVPGASGHNSDRDQQGSPGTVTSRSDQSQLPESQTNAKQQQISQSTPPTPTSPLSLPSALEPTVPAGTLRDRVSGSPARNSAVKPSGRTQSPSIVPEGSASPGAPYSGSVPGQVGQNFSVAAQISGQLSQRGQVISDTSSASPALGPGGDDNGGQVDSRGNGPAISPAKNVKCPNGTLIENYFGGGNHCIPHRTIRRPSPIKFTETPNALENVWEAQKKTLPYYGQSPSKIHRLENTPNVNSPFSRPVPRPLPQPTGGRSDHGRNFGSRLRNIGQSETTYVLPPDVMGSAVKQQSNAPNHKTRDFKPSEIRSNITIGLFNDVDKWQKRELLYDNAIKDLAARKDGLRQDQERRIKEAENKGIRFKTFIQQIEENRNKQLLADVNESTETLKLPSPRKLQDIVYPNENPYVAPPVIETLPHGLQSTETTGDVSKTFIDTNDSESLPGVGLSVDVLQHPPFQPLNDYDYGPSYRLPPAIGGDKEDANTFDSPRLASERGIPLFANPYVCQNPWSVDTSSTDTPPPPASPPPTSDNMPPPRTVREMLYWFVGLNQLGYIGVIAENVNGLFKDFKSDALEVTGGPISLTSSHVTDKLTEACLYAASVIYRVKYRDDYTTYKDFKFKSVYSQLHYSPDPAGLLCQLRDYVYACHHQLQFLKVQCNKNKSLGGWQDCHYGSKITSSKSPLQSFLTDGWDSKFKTHLFDPCDLCHKSRVRMGFEKEDLPKSSQLGSVISAILSATCGGSDPLLTLCSYLNCLTRRTPRTTGELVSFFHHFGIELHNYDKKVLSSLGSSLTKAHPNCPDWDHLDTANLDTVRGIRGQQSLISKHNSNHSNDHPKTLSTLVGCGSDFANCRPHCSPITYRAYALYSQSFAHTYLSWTVYLPDRLLESLEKLHYDLQKHRGSGKCSSLHQCVDALPLLYLHGFTPPEVGSHPKLTCSDVITTLKEIVNGGPIATLMTAMDNFLYGIREPFIYTLVTLWSTAFFFIANTMLYHLDVLRIRSHFTRSRGSHVIDVKALLADGTKMPSLYDIDYFDDDAHSQLGV